MSACRTTGQLEEYFQGALGPADEDEVEAHLFSCEACRVEAELVAALVLAVSRSLPPVLSPALFEALQRSGRVSGTTRVEPGQTLEATYPPQGSLLVHRLRLGETSDVGRVDLDLRTPEGGSLGRLEAVSFDAARGELLVACQHHFAEAYPADIVFAVELDGDPGRVLEYTVRHRREAR